MDHRCAPEGDEVGVARLEHVEDAPAEAADEFPLERIQAVDVEALVVLLRVAVQLLVVVVLVLAVALALAGIVAGGAVHRSGVHGDELALAHAAHGGRVALGGKEGKGEEWHGLGGRVGRVGLDARGRRGLAEQGGGGSAGLAVLVEDAEAQACVGEVAPDCALDLCEAVRCE